MRPSLRFLILAIFATGLTGLAVPLGGWIVLVPWTALIVLALADLTISQAPTFKARIEGLPALFTGQTRTAVLQFNRPVPAGFGVRFDWPDGLEGPLSLQMDASTESLDVEVFGKTRGEWMVERIFAAWSSRLGLWRLTPRIPIGLTVPVMPDIRPALSGEIDLKVHASLDGQKDYYAEGEGSEFHQLRDHAPGESLRRVDWKRSARQRRLLIKETRAERNHNVVAAIDCGYLMGEEIAGLAKLDHAVNAALALAWAAAVGGDKTGFFAYDSRPRLWLPPEPGRAMFPKLRRAAAGLAFEGRESNPTLGLASLGDQLRRRSLVIVFSDFVDTTTSELMLEQLSMLSRRHLIVFVALRDRETRTTAETPTASLHGAAEALAAAAWARERALVLDRMERMGVHVLDAEPEALTPDLVSTYLDLKSREMA